MNECQDLALLIKSLMAAAGITGALFLSFCYGFKRGSAK